MIYYHHIIWNFISYLLIVPVHLFVAYRFFMCTPTWKEGGWSKHAIRDKYRSYLDAFNFLDWDYEKSVMPYGKKTDEDKDVKDGP